MKCKVVAGSASEIETQMNEFLGENPGIKIVSVTQSSNTDSKQLYCVVVIYEEEFSEAD